MKDPKLDATIAIRLTQAHGTNVSPSKPHKRTCMIRIWPECTEDWCLNKGIGRNGDFVGSKLVFLCLAACCLKEDRHCMEGYQRGVWTHHDIGQFATM